jgi:hypothetical protein
VRRFAGSVVCAVALATAGPAQADFPLAFSNVPLSTTPMIGGGSVSAIAPGPAGEVYLGGSFRYVGPRVGGYLEVPAAGAGGVDTADFPAVNGIVEDVEPDGAGGWFVAGSFSRIGAQGMSNLAHVAADGSVDAAFAPAPDARVADLARQGSTLYLAGEFGQVAGEARDGLAALDADTGAVTAWEPAVDGAVGSLAVDASRVYLGGEDSGFSSVGGEPRRNVAAVDPSTGAVVLGWEANLNGVSAVEDLELAGTTLYVGGSFNSINGESRAKLGAVDAASGEVTAWNPGVGGGVPNGGFVRSIDVEGSTVYVAGSFTAAGGQSRDNVAAIDATTGAATAWNPDPAPGAQDQPRGLVDEVDAVGTTVYVGGLFDSVGGEPRDLLAAIDAGTGLATAWDPNPNGRATEVEGVDGTVVVGGQFTSAGAQNIDQPGLVRLKPDGSLDSSWDAEPDDDVDALALSGSTLYAAGDFASIGGLARTRLAAIDTQTAAADPGFDAGLGTNTFPDSLALIGPTLYVAGGFSSFAGQPRSDLAAVDAATGALTAWDPDADLGVSSLEAVGSTLYVAGNFNEIGGLTRHGLASFANGSAVPTGFDPGAPQFSFMEDISVQDSSAYVSGDFSSLGGQPRVRIGAADATTGAVLPFAPTVGGDMFGADIDVIHPAGSVVLLGGFDIQAVGGQPRGNLAAVDATSGAVAPWNPAIGRLALEVPPRVEAIGTAGLTVHVGGDFLILGGQVNGGYARFCCLNPPPGPGGGGNPPPIGDGAIPGNDFSVGKVKAAPKNGSVTITVDVPGPGALAATATAKVPASAAGRKKRINVAGARAEPKTAGPVRLTLKPKKKAKKVLRAKGKLKAKLALTFTPSGGAPKTTTRAVTFKLTKKKKKKR